MHVFVIFIFPSSQVLMQATFGHEAQERAALHEWIIELALVHFVPLLLLYFAFQICPCHTFTHVYSGLFHGQPHG